MIEMKNIGLVILFLTGITYSTQAQQTILDTLVKKFDDHRNHAFQEKIYAHLDRNFCLTGETLWFKLYAVDGVLHKPADISHVAYVELLDQAGFAVLQSKIELANGFGGGSLFIPASLASGNYRFRCYTSWMKNFPPEFYYAQTLTVVNPFVTPEPEKPSLGASYRVDFFPEGGHLVSGIQSKVAFRILDNSGRGATCHGVVIDDAKDTVATFAPRMFGLGHFFFTPSRDKKYKAILTGPSAKTTEHLLPEIQPTGYTMQIEDSGAHLQVTVRSAGVKEDLVYLFAHARQMVVCAHSGSLRNDSAVFSVRKDELPEGISHFTVFDNNLRPACERLYFTFPRKDLEISINASQKIFSARKKVAVSLATADATGPGPANLSVSVYRLDSLSSENRMTINPYLWLGSDLTGVIESPQYYFESRPEVRIPAMDNLMLTHGWRRFDWKHILEKRPAYSFLPELGDHIVSGIVTKDQEKARGVFTYLSSPGKIIRAYGSWSNDKGEIRFEIKDFFGPRRIILQTISDTTENYQVKIQDPFSPLRTTEPLPPFELSRQPREALIARSIAMQVQDVFYYEQYGNRIIQPAVDSSAFFGQADATYLLDDYTRFPVMEEVMREYVPGVFVRKRKDGFHFIVVDQVNRGILRGDPMVLVDGVPVIDVDNVMRMNPLRVKKMEIVNRPYYLGQAVFSGIVSYTTYQGDLGGLELDPRNVTLNYDGLQLKRQFHSPEYSRDQQNHRMPDQRYLLYWQPEITTDPHGKAQFEFFTSDVPGKYVIMVEGLNGAGYSGTDTCHFTVHPADNP